MSELAVRTISFSAAEKGGTVAPIDDREVWRYAGQRGMPEKGDEILSLLEQVKSETEPLVVYRVCCCETELPHRDGRPVLPFEAESQSLCRLLRGCDRVVLFAATIGIEIDRRIARYSRLSPSKALLLQAIGAERVEALADAFCSSYENGIYVQTRRFSPGYGDLPLSAQTELVRILECQKRIGLTLNESLMMSPSKSVTALFGLRKDNGEKPRTGSKCAACENISCEYRRG